MFGAVKLFFFLQTWAVYHFYLELWARIFLHVGFIRYNILENQKLVNVDENNVDWNDGMQMHSTYY